MILKYGDHPHPDGEVTVTIERTGKYDDMGGFLHLEETWNISGELIAADSDSLTTAIEDLEAAYAEDGKKAELLCGSTATPHVLPDTGDNVIKPPRVVSGPSYPKGDGPEYANQRHFEIRLEAAYIPEGREAANADDGLLAFQETISLWGGGPRIDWSEVIVGKPKKYVVAENTIYHATQRGSAVGKDRYPKVPDPKWPDLVVDKNPRLEQGQPLYNRVTDKFYEFPISWEFEFMSSDPFKLESKFEWPPTTAK